MAAISNNDAVIAKLLIDSGADVNLKDSSGYYPVHAVIEWDRDPKILESLLAHGADPMLKYRDQTAVDFVKSSQSEHRERYLELLDASRQSAASR